MTVAPLYRPGYVIVTAVPDSGRTYPALIRANSWLSGYRGELGYLGKYVHAAVVCVPPAEWPPIESSKLAAVGIEPGQPFLVEAASSGCRVRRLSAVDGRAPLFYAPPMTELQAWLWCRMALDFAELAVPYSWPAVAQFVLNMSPLPVVLPETRDGAELRMLCSRTVVEDAQLVAGATGAGVPWSHAIVRPHGRRPLPEQAVAPADLGFVGDLSGWAYQPAA